MSEPFRPPGGPPHPHTPATANPESHLPGAPPFAARHSERTEESRDSAAATPFADAPPGDHLPHTPPHPPHHTLTLRTARGPLTLDLHLALTAPCTVLFGPSGSGKSTILRAIAGLLPPAVHTLLRGNPAAPATDLTHTPPHLRQLAWAPQHTSLFPHLTVADNISFALRATGLSRDPAARDLVRAATTLLDLEPLLPRRPRDLSGGERQRVSLARALATPNARLLLLDEPFSNLDRATRDALLPRLRHHLAARALPVLSVTHDVEEAFLLQAEVVTLHAGHITAQGPAPTTLAAERARTLANLAP